MNHYPISSILNPSNLQQNRDLFVNLSGAIKTGIEFIIIEKSQLSHDFEPNLANEFYRFANVQKINIGCRLNNDFDLSSSNFGEWQYAHENLIMGLYYNNKNFNPRFFSFYPALGPVPALCYAFEHLNKKNILPQVSPDGVNLGIFIQKNNLVDWFCARHIRLIFETLNINNADASKLILFFEEQSRKLILEDRQPSFKFIKQLADKDEKIKKALEQYNINSLFEHWIEHGSKADESDAYKIIAQYLYLNHNNQYANFQISNINPDKIIELVNTGRKTYQNSIFKNNDIIYLVGKIASAVACAYIIGHFKTKDNSICFSNLDKTIGKISAYEFIQKTHIPVLFANAKPQNKGHAHYLRLNTIRDYIDLAQSLDNGLYSGVSINLENLMLNLADIEKNIDSLNSGDGKFIKEVIVDLIAKSQMQQTSHSMYSLYSIIYTLKQKSMDIGYLSFSYSINNRTATMLKIIRYYLEKNTHPKDLPASFYGIDENIESLNMRAMHENIYKLLDKI